MKRYSADIGTWERGRRIEFEADSDREALKKAHTYCADNDDVVQIHRLIAERGYMTRPQRILVYDYMNGFFENQIW